MIRRVPRTMWGVALSGAMLGVVAYVLVWHGPDWDQVGDAFTVVAWWWIAAAIALNVCSVLSRCLSWHVVITQAMPPPHPRFRQTFSSFSVGLLANSVLPGRIGELARVGVLARHLPAGKGIWATLTGTVFAHRLFDLFPATLLLIYVLQTAKIPHWAATSLYLFVGIGAALFAFALAGAKRHNRTRFADADRRLQQLLTMARTGLGVMRAPLPAVGAALLQTLGWGFQLAAIYVAMRAFGIHESLPAAALVLALMNVATVFPLWPGNVGLVQAAVALPARLLRRRQGARVRLRDRTAGDRRRRRSRPRVDRARSRGRHLRDAEADAGPHRGGRAGAAGLGGSCQRDACARSRARLASRASCRPRRPRPRWPPASARPESRRTSARSQTAAREPPRCSSLRSAASGERRTSPIRSAGRSSCALARAAGRHCGGGVRGGARSRICSRPRSGTR